MILSSGASPTQVKNVLRLPVVGAHQKPNNKVRVEG